MRLEELHMENEYQLCLKDMNYKEKMKELSDNFTQQIESLKTMQQVCCSPTRQLDSRYVSRSQFKIITSSRKHQCLYFITMTECPLLTLLSNRTSLKTINCVFACLYGVITEVAFVFGMDCIT